MVEENKIALKKLLNLKNINEQNLESVLVKIRDLPTLETTDIIHCITINKRELKSSIQELDSKKKKYDELCFTFITNKIKQFKENL